MLLLFPCVLPVSDVVAQEHRYENLVFEGGGIRGIAYAGVIEQLDSMAILKDVKRVGGTSAGAVAATVLSLNYSGSEITEMMRNLNFKRFNQNGFPVIGGLIRVVNEYGYYNNQRLHNWIGRMIREKTGNENITFLELREQGYRDLYVTGTALNSQKTIVFSSETFPNMQVKDAVLISMTVPLYFKAVFIDTSGRMITKKGAARMDSSAYYVMVDGGIAANMPIYIFDDRAYTDTCMDEEFRCINPRTLAVRLDSDKQIELDRQGANRLAFEPVRRFPDFLRAFYTYSLEKLNRPLLVEEDWERTILVSSADISPRLKELKEEEKELLIENGREGVRLYFRTSQSQQ